jgi:methylenetetrahydrofolate reductase (NADPH)
MASRFTSRETPEQRAHRLALIAELTFEIVPLSTAEPAAAALPPGSRVSVTCSPVKGIEATMALTDHIRALGHHVVPHLSARMVSGSDHVAAIATWLRNAGIDEIFVVAGDAEDAAGPYVDALAFLRALLDTDLGLRTVGVTAYPDHHPLIAAETLHEALHAKQALLADAGIEGYATTQMCFDPGRIASWLHSEREQGLTLPIHLGVPGVVDRARLMTMGVRLGVGASLRYLRKNRSALTRLVVSPHYDPNKLLGALSPVLHPYGVAGIHCFTFNQVAATAAWQHKTSTRS